MVSRLCTVALYVALMSVLFVRADRDDDDDHDEDREDCDDRRVVICKIPPGNPGNRRTITVDARSVWRHLATGSTLGPCATSCRNSRQCDDDDLCTSDSCVAGRCVNVAVTCDDGNACTSNTCSPKRGCIYTRLANGASCNDGNSCTSGDVCQRGRCAGVPVNCTGDLCNTAACSAASGACVLTPVVIDDNNVCTIDTCGPTGIVHTYVPNCCQSDADCPSTNPCASGT